MPDAIDPSKIPGKDIDPDTIDEQAGTIGTLATSVRDNGSNVHLSWQGMAAVYSAPEAPALLGLMQPVSSQATTAGDNLGVVSAALVQFAADVRPIKAELDSLRLQAQWFVDNTVRNGVDVKELNPAWVSTQGYYGTTAASTAYSYSSSTGGTTSTADIPKYHTVHKAWHEDQDAVDRNNDLIHQVNAQMVLLWEAERTCANKIRALYGAAPLHSFQSEDDALGYGLDEIPEGTEMPWGADVERSESCGEATVNFVFKDFLWEGIVVGGIWGTIEGLGTLVLGYNPATGAWFDGDAYGAAWGNLGLLVADVAINSSPLAVVFVADDVAGAFGGGFLPDEVRDFKDKADEAMLNTGKALIAWDQWQDDPGTALGETVFNVGTILLPAGAAITGVKTAGTAANVLSKMARVADLVDPGAWAVNGAVKVGGLAFKGIDGIVGKLDLGGLADDVGGGVEVYRGADATSALDSMIDDLNIPVEQITSRIDDGVPVLEAPGIRVELPEGAFDLPGAHGVAGDAAVPAPVREPELVMAGGAPGDAPHVVNSIVDEAPVRTDTGGSGDSTVIRDPETATGGSGVGHGGSDAGHGGSGLGDGPDSGHGGSDGGDSGNGGSGAGDSSDAGHGGPDAGHGGPDAGDGGPVDPSAPATPISDSIAAGTDPVHSGAAGVPGEWQRVADDPITPKDLHYGEPMTAHGTATMPTKPSGVTSGYDYVSDPAAPYGRFDDGTPLSKADYDARYVFSGKNWDNYPPNAGAVRGSRVAYTDPAAFLRDYGDALDRVGPPRGDYLGVKPDGVAATFEERGLPLSSLAKEVFDYSFTGRLPSGWTIEVSEIAKAFGQPGGGLQVLFRDATGKTIPVFDLVRRGVLAP